jgi:hypothetical protein
LRSVDAVTTTKSSPPMPPPPRRWKGTMSSDEMADAWAFQKQISRTWGREGGKG